MSIFNTILHKIFPADHPAVTDAVPPVTVTASAVPDIAVVGSTQPVPAEPVARLQVPRPDTEVDVGRVLADKASAQGQALNWRTSIVDLLKLLGLPSDMSARVALARELDYPGSTEDSAAMNVWLHREVMRKLALNGGRVPEDLR